MFCVWTYALEKTLDGAFVGLVDDGCHAWHDTTPHCQVWKRKSSNLNSLAGRVLEKIESFTTLTMSVMWTVASQRAS